MPAEWERIGEAHKYLDKFRGQTIVVKYGGDVGRDVSTIAEDIAFLRKHDVRVAVVHGGGPQFDAAMEKAKLKPVKIGGLRVTDAKTMKIVGRQSGKVRREMIAHLKAHGVPAVGLGRKEGIVRVFQKAPELGFVGEVRKVRTDLLHKHFREGRVPVTSPIGVDKKGVAHNVNADEVAAHVAVALKAAKVIFMTNVAGVTHEGRLIPTLSVSEAKEHIKSGVIHGGMMPKAKAMIHAVEHGVGKAHIIDGTKPHALLNELLTDPGVGTEIVLHKKH